MSTYTDLQNKVKEALNIDYHTRITSQKARFLNEENEYWGTFNGKLNVDSTTITSAEIKDSTLRDVTLVGDIKIGNYDLPGFGTKLTQISDDINEINRAMATESNIRSLTDASLCSLINHNNEKITTNLSIITSNINYLSSEHNNLCSDLCVHIKDLSSNLSNHINYLSSEHNNLCSDLYTSIQREAQARTTQDLYLESLITTVSDNIVLSVDKKDKNLYNTLESDIEKYRHYSICNLFTHDPYILSDFTVNVLNAKTFTGKLIDDNGYTFATYKDITDNIIELTTTINNSYYDAIDGNATYTLSVESPVQLKNEYTISYNKRNVIISKNIPEYYSLSCDLIPNIQGKITNVQWDANGGIQSCDLIITDYDAFQSFTTFGQQSFKKGESKVSNGEYCKITLDDSGIFIFQKGKDVKQYVALTEQNTGTQFARIYKNNVFIDTDGNYTYIGVKYNGSLAILTPETNYTTTLTSYNYNTLSCELDNKDNLATFSIYETQHTYNAYNNTVNDTISVHLPINRLLNDETLTSNISVLFAQNTKCPDLNKPFELKYISNGIWEVKNDVREEVLSCNITLNSKEKTIKININGQTSSDISLLTDGSSTYVDQTFIIDPIPISVSKNILTSTPIVIPFNYDIDSSSYTDTYRVTTKEYIPEQTTTCTFTKISNNTVRFQIPKNKFENISREALVAIKLTDDTNHILSVNFYTEDQIDKTQPVITTTIETNKQAYLQLQEITKSKFIVTDLAANETDWKFDWLKTKLFGLSNELSIISTDINLDIDKLSTNLSTEIRILSGNLSNEINHLSSSLSGDVDNLSANLCAEVKSTKNSIYDIYERIGGIINYKGELYLSTSYEPSDYSGIKRFFINNLIAKGYTEDEALTYKLSANWFYIIKAVDQAHYTIDSIEVEDHDYLSINKNILIKDITSVDFNITDVMDKDVFHLSANNQIIVGEDNYYIGKQLFEKLSSNTLTVDNINISSNTALSSYNTLISAISVSIDSLQNSDGIINNLSSNNSKISTLTVDNGLINNLNVNELSTSNISSITNKSKNIIVDNISTNIQLSAKEIIVDNTIVNKISATNLSVDILINNTAKLSTATINNITISNNLSVNSNNVYLTDKVSTLNEELTYLHSQTSAQTQEISTVSSDLSILSRHYYDRSMSCDNVIEHIIDPNGKHTHISATVDKLLIVDEVTFDIYALTIRNGCLNINKVSAITETQNYYK